MDKVKYIGGYFITNDPFGKNELFSIKITGGKASESGYYIIPLQCLYYDQDVCICFQNVLSYGAANMYRGENLQMICHDVRGKSPFISPKCIEQLEQIILKSFRGKPVAFDYGYNYTYLAKPRRIIKKEKCERLVPPFQFIDYLFCNFDYADSAITEIRFSCAPGNDTVCYVADLFIPHNETVRDLFINSRKEIYMKTGWITFVKGQSINEAKSQYDIIALTNHLPPKELGDLIEISNIAADPSSTALLLKCENGAILFDTGFGIKQEYINTFDFIVISHLHKDHTGGLIDILQKRKVPVLLSSVTLSFMQTFLSDADKEILAKNSVLIDVNPKTRIWSRNVMIFNSYHAPGEFGIAYQSGKDLFVYPGDFCLRNGYCEYQKYLLSFLSQFKDYNIHFAMDCAMVREQKYIGSMLVEDVMNDIINSQYDSIIISNGIESLIHGYIMLFSKSIGKMEFNLAANTSMFEILRQMRIGYKSRNYLLDYYLEQTVYKHGGKADFFMSPRLYSVDNSSEPLIKRTAYFLTINDEPLIKKVLNSRKTDIYIIGKIAAKGGISDGILQNENIMSVKYLSFDDWYVHSSKKDIIEFIENTDLPIHFILFHSFHRVLSAFVSAISDEKKKDVVCVGTKPESLRIND